MIQVQFTPELESRLAAQAAKEGVSVEAFITEAARVRLEDAMIDEGIKDDDAGRVYTTEQVVEHLQGVIDKHKRVGERGAKAWQE